MSLRLALISLGVACSTPTSDAPPARGADTAPVTACGGQDQPDCPLQAWMKSTVQAYLNAGDKARLAKSLDELGRHAPDGFDQWSAAAAAGAAAARAGDVTGVRAQCQACHDQYRASFRTQMRTSHLF